MKSSITHNLEKYNKYNDLLSMNPFNDIYTGKVNQYQNLLQAGGVQPSAMSNTKSTAEIIHNLQQAIQNIKNGQNGGYKYKSSAKLSGMRNMKGGDVPELDDKYKGLIDVDKVRMNNIKDNIQGLQADQADRIKNGITGLLGLRGENVDLKAKVAELEAQILASKTATEQLQQQYDQVKADKEILTKEKEALQQEINTLKEAIAKVQEELKNTATPLAAIEKEKLEADAKIADLEKQLIDKQINIDKKQQEILLLKDQMTEHNADQTKLTQQVEELKKTIDALRGNFNENNEDVNTKITTYQKSTDEKLKSYQDVMNDIDQLVSSLNQSK